MKRSVTTIHFFNCPILLITSLCSVCIALLKLMIKDEFYAMDKGIDLRDKIKGAWAAQTIGVTYGGPTEFRYNKRIIPDSIEIHWSDTMMYHWMKNIPWFVR